MIGGPVLGPSGRILRRLRLTGDPIRDAKALGPLAMQIAYVVIARAERASRRSRPIPIAAAIIRGSAPASPVVLVQCESFFDPRRIHSSIHPDLLPTFDTCRRSSVEWGRLRVPSWGANTVRSEFAVLTGMAEEAIGFDRFNPYHSFARFPVGSLAWRMRAEGYRTICLHPFDRKFYRREQAMMNLGFETFLGEEAFSGASRVGLFVADIEVARVAAELLREEGPGIFLFAITMENHGPWVMPTDRPICDLAPRLPAVPEEKALRQFIRSVENADGMLRILCETLAAGDKSGLLAFYGDHLPSFPAAFAALGFRDRRSDYVIWSPQAGAARRRDLAAHELPAAILDALGAATASSRELHSRVG
jgi:phosphoglycerol transferase MdoB-like AlkP superfamily enzyme